MKRFLLLLAAAACTLAACNPDKPDENTDDTPKTPQPGVYKFVLADYGTKVTAGQDGKTSWEAGDEIFVTGGYEPGAITVTLKASDISTDGKTATVQLDKVPSSVFAPDNFYAAWPAGLVDRDDMFSDDRFVFTATDAPLMSAWLEGDTFTFNHICGAVSFTAPGGYDGCVLTGSNWQIVSYDSWGVEINSDYQDYVYKKGDSGYFRRKDLAGDSAILYFPNGVNLSDGFRIYLRKGDSYPKVYEGSGVKVSRGTILALGDISSMLQDYSGPAPEMPAMPVMGKVTRIDVPEVPELSGLCLTADKSAMWTVGDNGWFGQVGFDGTVTKWWTMSADLEGITLHPGTGDLYLANEPSKVFRLKPPYAKPSSWETAITVEEAKNYGNSGMEGITYYKDDMLFAGTQVDANVWLYKTDGTLVKGPVSLRKLSSYVKEVGGLCYDSVNDWLWVTDSEAAKLFVFDTELTHLMAQYRLPNIHNAESVCVDHAHDCVWVGLDDDDVCAIFKVEFSGLNP